ncbi:peptidase U32 family protein [Desulfobacterales bacterium HSG2]|nr:peptidase U32 family protein [Desulfobacterales bacterium HSG2]
MTKLPLILAPAGSKDSFLAALAAGADAIYCGLKHFSARMEAKNFSVEELADLTALAHDKGAKVYVALNSLIKPGELNAAGGLLDQLNRQVKPDALIIQDFSLLQLAEQTGFSGELHLSTLTSVSFPGALKLIREGFGPRVSRVVMPRELGIDEIRAMSQACPQGLELEVFVHGAICYGISGRCYWSSFFGGKSGLRGRCVQPCRRLYTQNVPGLKIRNEKRTTFSDSRQKPAGQRKGRFFSCRDLSLDVLVKALLSVPKVRAWKIEGRKKGPHYVFYTVKAYQILRDHGSDPQMKKTAMGFLARSLGRPGTHYYFLPQRPQNPVNLTEQTGSGLFIGRVKRGSKPSRSKSPAGGEFYIVPRDELLPGDVLRIGYEDEPWHSVRRVGKYVPKKGRLHLKFPSRKKPPKGSPIFLTDRREKALEKLLAELEAERQLKRTLRRVPPNFHVRLPGRFKKGRFFKKNQSCEIHVKRNPGRGKSKDQTGIWLSVNKNAQFSAKNAQSSWWWLPPAIWPGEEEKWKATIDLALSKGCRNFVLNAPWQMAFFVPGNNTSRVQSPLAQKFGVQSSHERGKKGLSLWAGPFCNLANTLAVDTMADIGFSGVIVSPELGREDYLRLPEQSPLPLGIIISGNWPLCVSHIFPENLETGRPFTSPRGEHAWIMKYGDNVWIYPNWKIDIRTKKDELLRAGYYMFVHLTEPLPKTVELKKRQGLWNWDVGLL